MRTIGFWAAGAIAAGAGLLPSTATAGPWTMPAGKGRAILTAIYSNAGRSFDGQGDSQPAPDYEQYQMYLLAEYGVTDRLTVFANPSLRRVEVEDTDRTSGLGYTELGARYKLLDRSGFVLSAQASGFIPGRGRRDRVAQIGSTDGQFDMRLQGGYGFDLAGVKGFTSVEGSYRLRGGDMPNEVHGDATLGIHATKRFMVIGNLYNTWSDGAGRNGFPSYRYTNAYLGGVYDLNDRVSLQLGGLGTISGRNALRERGVYTGFWIKF